MLSRQGTSLLIWMVVFTIVITVVVYCRFLAARIQRRDLRPDDYLIVAAYVSAEASSLPARQRIANRKTQISTLALESNAWWGIANGLGAHTSQLNKYQLGVQYKVSWRKV